MLVVRAVLLVGQVGLVFDGGVLVGPAFSPPYSLAVVALMFCLSWTVGCCALFHFFSSLARLAPLALLLATLKSLTFLFSGCAC